MKKLISILLSAIMLISFTACQNNSENNMNSTKNYLTQTQTENTPEEKIQSVNEFNYENTNYIARSPQGKPKYKVEEISFNEAAESSGYSISDRKFRIADIHMENNYIVPYILYSNVNSTDFCAYSVIYDLDGNMIANISNIAINEGYDKSVLICGVFSDYAVLCMHSKLEPLKNIYALYNLKTKEIKYIQYAEVSLKNGIIIVGNSNPEKEYSYLYGALDLDLNEIIPTEYDELKLASTELFIAKKGKKYGIIDFNNSVIADFKYKEIQSFTGIDDSKDLNPISLMDFEKNINKYTVAIDENGKSVMIDKKGNKKNVDFDISTDMEYGRTVSQYEDKILIKHSEGKIISDLEGNVLLKNEEIYSRDGFINGFCNTMDSKGNCKLIDTKGNVVYSESANTPYGGVEISSVDQNGLFLVSNYNNAYSYKIMDLSKNKVYVSEEKISSIGNGMFKKITSNGLSLLKVTVY
ncbi:MAG: hypothetical protein ACI4RM_05025 [Ruminococcus sp.]